MKGATHLKWLVDRFVGDSSIQNISGIYKREYLRVEQMPAETAK